MSHLPCYTIRIKNMKNKMKTFRVETEDRYGQFDDYDFQAESLEAATAIANKRVNLPNGAVVTDIKELAVSQNGTTFPKGESTKKVGDDFRDMMPTAEEFWYDAQPEAYEPNCYDGTYSEM